MKIFLAPILAVAEPDVFGTMLGGLLGLMLCILAVAIVVAWILFPFLLFSRLTKIFTRQTVEHRERLRALENLEATTRTQNIHLKAIADNSATACHLLDRIRRRTGDRNDEEARAVAPH